MANKLDRFKNSGDLAEDELTQIEGEANVASDYGVLALVNLTKLQQSLIEGDEDGENEEAIELVEESIDSLIDSLSDLEDLVEIEEDEEDEI